MPRPPIGSRSSFGRGTPRRPSTPAPPASRTASERWRRARHLEHRSLPGTRGNGRRPAAAADGRVLRRAPAATRLHALHHLAHRRLHRRQEDRRQHAHHDRQRRRAAATLAHSRGCRSGSVGVLRVGHRRRSTRAGTSTACRPPTGSRRARPPTTKRGSHRNAPSMVRNSPTKPLRPGMPIDASVMIRNAAVSRGITLLQAAELADQARVPAVRQHADDEEEPAGADAVRQHLVDRALHALHVHRADAEHDEARGGSPTSRPPASSCPAAPSPRARRRRCR